MYNAVTCVTQDQEFCVSGGIIIITMLLGYTSSPDANDL